jgi:hypothetical protein
MLESLYHLDDDIFDRYGIISIVLSQSTRDKLLAEM